MLEGNTILPTIEAGRLRIRWLSEGDITELFEIFSDEKVTRYFGVDTLTDEAGARRLLDSIHALFDRRELFQWGVALRDGDRVVGTCTLASLDPKNQRAEIGFALGSAHWGKGYMIEALPRFLDFSFDDLGLHRIEADVDPRNAPSIAILEKLGFRREGYLSERHLQDGERQDSICYGLLGPKWRERA